MVYETFRPGSGLGSIPAERRHNSVSPANWLDWQRESRSLESLAAWRGASFTLTGVGAPVRLSGQLVSSEFFSTSHIRTGHGFVCARRPLPKYESYVDLLPGVWTKVKIDVRGERARLYVHDQEQPTLIVNDLKTGAQRNGGVALWIDRGTVAHFRTLSVHPSSGK